MSSPFDRCRLRDLESFNYPQVFVFILSRGKLLAGDKYTKAKGTRSFPKKIIACCQFCFDIKLIILIGSLIYNKNGRTGMSFIAILIFPLLIKYKDVRLQPSGPTKCQKAPNGNAINAQKYQKILSN